MIDKAIQVAALAHEGQVRKGTSIPYITHPFAVGLMLARAGCPGEMVVAGILHDTVEDTGLALDYIEKEFGPRVAAIVEGCSEPDKSAPWEVRKRHTLDYLRAAPWEVRVVSCADKLHNLGTIATEHASVGEAVWTRFKRGRAEQEWYFRGLLAVLCDGSARTSSENPFCSEFRALVEEVFGPSPAWRRARKPSQ
jgi:(p)ppGpp synthase/HD superfamily hydrolase